MTWTSDRATLHQHLRVLVEAAGSPWATGIEPADRRRADARSGWRVEGERSYEQAMTATAPRESRWAR
jgi:hypothetical protein